MKKKLLLLVFLLPALCTLAQQEVPQIVKSRLNEYMRYTRELNFEKVMDLAHPSLFTLAPREQLVEMFNKVYDNETMAITIDSVAVGKFGNVFPFKGATYILVEYYIALTVRFKSMEIDEELENQIVESLEKNVNGKEVRYDNGNNAFSVRGNDKLFAIRDSGQSDWMFLGYDPKSPAVVKLFPVEVLEHYGLGQK